MHSDEVGRRDRVAPIPLTAYRGRSLYPDVWDDPQVNWQASSLVAMKNFLEPVDENRGRVRISAHGVHVPMNDLERIWPALAGENGAATAPHTPRRGRRKGTSYEAADRPYAEEAIRLKAEGKVASLTEAVTQIVKREGGNIRGNSDPARIRRITTLAAQLEPRAA